MSSLDEQFQADEIPEEYLTKPADEEETKEITEKISTEKTETTEIVENSKKVEEFPNGFGLSIEEVKAVLAKENKSIVPDDDPILLVVTILNCFLFENEKKEQKYQEALKKIYSEQSSSYVTELVGNLDNIKNLLENVSVDGLNKLHAENTQELANFKVSMMWATGIIALSAFINVAVFILH